MVGIGEQVYAEAVTRVALRRTGTGPVQASGANTTRFTAGAAMAGVATRVDTLAVTKASGRARAAALDARLTSGTYDAAFAAIERILPKVSAAIVTRHAAPGAKAASARAVLSGSTSHLTAAAVGCIVQHVHTTGATVQEAGATHTSSTSATFRCAAHVTAFAAVRRIEREVRAVAIRTQGHRVRAITDALVRETDVFPAVVATSPTVVVVGAQVDAESVTQTRAIGTPARARNTLLPRVTSHTTRSAIQRITRDVDARISASSRTWRTLTTSRITGGTPWTRRVATTTMAGVACCVDARIATLLKIPFTLAAPTATRQTWTTGTSTLPTVGFIDSEIRAVVARARRTLGVGHALRQRPAEWIRRS
jgi:hypothetical protein